MRLYRRRAVHPGRRKALLFLLFLLALASALYIVFTIQVMPVVCTIAAAKARIESTKVINDAVSTVLREDDISYDKLMSFEKNSAGKITAVKADTLQINLFKYDITNEIVDRLDHMSSSNLGIPIGTVIGGPIFTNRGPRVSVDILPVGNVDTSVTSSFTSTGINQTRQRIMLDVKTNITVIIASYNVNTAVESNVVIAETVIVGDVPGQYTVVEDSSDPSKIFTYDPNQKK